MVGESSPAGITRDLTWLRDAPKQVEGVAYDPGGWDDSVWILHAMYEVPGADSRSHDEVHRAAIERGEVARNVVNGVDLDRVGTNTGVPLGMSCDPGSGWRRLRWSELAARLQIKFPLKVWPSYTWFPYRSWPASIQPPCEGSLDRESLQAVVRVLSNHSAGGADVTCHFLHVPTLWTEPKDAGYVVGSLSGAPMFGATEDLPGFSPSNMWPGDRSWFVYTDYDLCGTKVSGSAALIAALRAEPDLETLDWPSPSAGSSG